MSLPLAPLSLLPPDFFKVGVPEALSPAPLFSLPLYLLSGRLYPTFLLLQPLPSLGPLSKFPMPSTPTTYWHLLPRYTTPLDATYTLPPAELLLGIVPVPSEVLLPPRPEPELGSVRTSRPPGWRRQEEPSPRVPTPGVKSSRDGGTEKEPRVAARGEGC